MITTAHIAPYGMGYHFEGGVYQGFSLAIVGENIADYTDFSVLLIAGESESDFWSRLLTEVDTLAASFGHAAPDAVRLLTTTLR